MDYSILRAKSNMKVTDPDTGNEMSAVNLLSKTFNGDIDFTSGMQTIEVTHEYIGRPDLVSLAVYNNDSYADILCKINGISNPFELNEGMILVCPAQSGLRDLIDIDSDSSDVLVKDDDSLVKKEKSNKKQKDEKRSPNEATVDVHNYTLSADNSIVFY